MAKIYGNKENEKKYLDSSVIIHENEKLNEILDDLYYKPGDTFSFIMGTPLAALLTNSTMTIRFAISTEKSLKNITTITCNSLQAEIRGISGYLNNTSGFNEYVGKSDYTITCKKATNYMFDVNIKKSTAFTNVSNNTPISVILNSLSKFTFN